MAHPPDTVAAMSQAAGRLALGDRGAARWSAATLILAVVYERTTPRAETAAQYTAPHTQMVVPDRHVLSHR